LRIARRSCVFNTAAFAQPAQFTFGKAGRNILRTDTKQHQILAI
jgi:hypothetical protein